MLLYYLNNTKCFQELHLFSCLKMLLYFWIISGFYTAFVHLFFYKFNCKNPYFHEWNETFPVPMGFLFPLFTWHQMTSKSHSSLFYFFFILWWNTRKEAGDTLLIHYENEGQIIAWQWRGGDQVQARESAKCLESSRENRCPGATLRLVRQENMSLQFH